MQSASHKKSAHAGKTKSQLIAELTAREREIAALTGSRPPNDVVGILTESRVFQTLIDVLPAPVFFKNRSGVYLGCNKRFEEYLGRDRSDIVGHTAYDLASRELADVYTEADEALFVSGGEQIYETQVSAIDGDLRDVRFHKAIFEAGDDTETLIGVIFDISEIKRAEERNLNLIDAFDALGEMVAVIDADERYIFCNRQYRNLNQAVPETLGPGCSFEEHLRTIAELELVPEAIGRIEDWVAERMDQHRNPSEPFELERQDGTWMLVRTQRLADGSAIILGTEITKLKEADAALHAALSEVEHASQAKSEFLATMSHEFRTPLNAILGFSDVLRTEHFGPLGSENYVTYASDIHKSGIHMLDLVNDVLDVAAIEAGQRSSVIELIELDTLISDSIRNVAGACKSGGIRLTQDIATGLPAVYGDSRAITQILHNLLSNAVKFTESGGSIDLSVTANGADFVIEVRDTGIGIPADKLPFISDPFVQANSNPHQASKGTGLGLSIVKSLVEILEGELNIESEVGIGTTVRIALPLLLEKP